MRLDFHVAKAPLGISQSALEEARRSADALGGEHVDAQRKLGPIGI